MALNQIDVTRDVLNVNLIVNSDINPDDINYYILITKWTSTEFEIFVNFTDPLKVSVGSIPDEMILSVKNSILIFVS